MAEGEEAKGANDLFAGNDNVYSAPLSLTPHGILTRAQKLHSQVGSHEDVHIQRYPQRPALGGCPSDTDIALFDPREIALCTVFKAAQEPLSLRPECRIYNGPT